MSKSKKVNLGCGNVYINHWYNYDYVGSKYVNVHDLSKSIPLSDNSMEFTYSSHIIEHFSKEDGKKFLCEQYRILKPGGIIRIVFPDLFTLCKNYVHKYSLYNSSNESKSDYQWAVIELIDQLTRCKTGGEMRKFLFKSDLSDFVKGRLGGQGKFYNPICSSYFQSFNKVLKFLFNPLSYLLQLHKDPRHNGEGHKWMYDFHSMYKLLQNIGFQNIKEFSYDSSYCEDWINHNLDALSDLTGPRKPDSIFIEAIK